MSSLHMAVEIYNLMNYKKKPSSVFRSKRSYQCFVLMSPWKAISLKEDVDIVLYAHN